MEDGKNKDITYFAETDFRNKKVPFGIKSLDRARHVYVIGKTGMGKSTLLENMTIQDIRNGNGVAYMDPHGSSAELFLDYIPKERIKDVIYFAPHDMDFPIAFNVMEDVGKDQRHLVANGLMAAFKKIWPDVWSARMEYISTNIILALLEYPDSTLLGVNRMLSDKVYRKKVVDHLTDPVVKSFWVDEFAKYSDKLMVEAGASIQNKFGQFVSNPLIRNIVGQPKSTFDLRDVMDGKKFLIMDLSKGKMGEINANLIGGMLITKIYLAAMSRARVEAKDLKKLPSFYFFVDEFQSFVNDSFKDILSEARKYKLCLTLAHQYIEQVPEEVRDAVFGNVGTTIAFRVGPFDAEVMEKVFAPKFIAEDLVNLGFAQIYLTLMIDGVGSPPFSAKTIPPFAKPEISFKREVIEYSRKTYARPRAEVDEEIRKWHEEQSGVGATGFDKKPFIPKDEQFKPQSFDNRGPKPWTDKPLIPKEGQFRPQSASNQFPQSRPKPPYQAPKFFNQPPFVSSTPRPAQPPPPGGPTPKGGLDIQTPAAPAKMSLSELAKGVSPVADKPKSTGKNMADLKSAISQAMKTGKTAPKTVVKVSGDPISGGRSDLQVPERPHKVEEVPKEILRKILDTETNKE